MIGFLSDKIARLFWALGLIHVPELDNVYDPFTGEISAPAEELPADATAWTKYSRFDGVNLTPDFRDWTSFDERVTSDRGLTDTQIEHYCAIKPHVLMKESESEIARLTGRSVSLVQKIRPAVREMIEIRYKEEYAAKGSHFVELW